MERICAYGASILMHAVFVFYTQAYSIHLTSPTVPLSSHLWCSDFELDLQKKNPWIKMNPHAKFGPSRLANYKEHTDTPT